MARWFRIETRETSLEVQADEIEAGPETLVWWLGTGRQLKVLELPREEVLETLEAGPGDATPAPTQLLFGVRVNGKMRPVPGDGWTSTPEGGGHIGAIRPDGGWQTHLRAKGSRCGILALPARPEWREREETLVPAPREDHVPAEV